MKRSRNEISQGGGSDDLTMNLPEDRVIIALSSQDISLPSKRSPLTLSEDQHSEWSTLFQRLLDNHGLVRGKTLEGNTEVGRGLLATDSLTPGEPICGIPDSLILTPNIALKSEVGRAVEERLSQLCLWSTGRLRSSPNAGRGEDNDASQGIDEDDDMMDDSYTRYSLVRRGLLLCEPPVSSCSQPSSLTDTTCNDEMVLLRGQLALYAFLMVHRIRAASQKPQVECPQATSPSSDPESTFWTSYAAWLPSTYSDPLWWPPSVAAELLQGTNLDASVKQRRQCLASIYLSVFPQLTHSHPHLFPPSQTTFALFLWAHSSYTSRSFPDYLLPPPSNPTSLSSSLVPPRPYSPNHRKCGLMMPYLDLTNHRSDYPVYWVTTQRLSSPIPPNQTQTTPLPSSPSSIAPWSDVSSLSHLPPARSNYPTIVRISLDRSATDSADPSSISDNTGLYVYYVSATPYKKGDQIFNNYGPKSNEELLFAYGFVDAGVTPSPNPTASTPFEPSYRRNPHHHVPLSLGGTYSYSSTGLVSARALNIIRLLNLPSLHFLKSDGLPSSLLSLLNLLALSSTFASSSQSLASSVSCPSTAIGALSFFTYLEDQLIHNISSLRPTSTLSSSSSTSSSHSSSRFPSAASAITPLSLLSSDNLPPSITLSGLNILRSLLLGKLRAMDACRPFYFHDPIISSSSSSSSSSSTTASSISPLSTPQATWQSWAPNVDLVALQALYPSYTSEQLRLLCLEQSIANSFLLSSYSSFHPSSMPPISFALTSSRIDPFTLFCAAEYRVGTRAVLLASLELVLRRIRRTEEDSQPHLISSLPSSNAAGSTHLISSPSCAYCPSILTPYTSWLQSVGGICRISLSCSGGQLRPVVSESVSAFEPIVLLPKKIWITVQAARSSSTFAKLARHPLLLQDDALTLVFYIAHERLKGTKSKWSPFFKSLAMLESLLTNQTVNATHSLTSPSAVTSPGFVGMACPSKMLNSFTLPPPEAKLPPFSQVSTHSKIEDVMSDSITQQTVTQSTITSPPLPSTASSSPPLSQCPFSSPSQPHGIISRSNGFVDFVKSVIPKLRKAQPSLFEGATKSSVSTSSLELSPPTDASMTLESTPLLLWAASIVDSMSIPTPSSLCDLITYANHVAPAPRPTNEEHVTACEDGGELCEVEVKDSVEVGGIAPNSAGEDRTSQTTVTSHGEGAKKAVVGPKRRKLSGQVPLCQRKRPLVPQAKKRTSNPTTPISSTTSASPPRPSLAVIPFPIILPSQQQGTLATTVPISLSTLIDPISIRHSTTSPVRNWSFSTLPAVQSVSNTESQKTTISPPGGLLSSGIRWTGTQQLASLASKQPQLSSAVTLYSHGPCAAGESGSLVVNRGEGEIEVVGMTRARAAGSSIAPSLYESVYTHSLFRMLTNQVGPSSMAGATVAKEASPDTTDRENGNSNGQGDEVAEEGEADDGVILPYSCVDITINHAAFLSPPLADCHSKGSTDTLPPGRSSSVSSSAPVQLLDSNVYTELSVKFICHVLRAYFKSSPSSALSSPPSSTFSPASPLSLVSSLFTSMRAETIASAIDSEAESGEYSQYYHDLLATNQDTSADTEPNMNICRDESSHRSTWGAIVLSSELPVYTLQQQIKTTKDNSTDNNKDDQPVQPPLSMLSPSVIKAVLAPILILFRAMEYIAIKELSISAEECVMYARLKSSTNIQSGSGYDGYMQVYKEALKVILATRITQHTIARSSSTLAPPSSPPSLSSVQIWHDQQILFLSCLINSL